jgi:hypothetical protein
MNCNRKQDQYDDARGLFKDICNKKLDWPEVIWEAWIAFEHLYGSVQDLEDCLDRVEKARGFLQSRRLKVCPVTQSSERCSMETRKRNRLYLRVWSNQL